MAYLQMIIIALKRGLNPSKETEQFSNKVTVRQLSWKEKQTIFDQEPVHFTIKLQQELLAPIHLSF